MSLVRRAGHDLWTFFQTPYDKVSGPGAAKLEDLERAAAISS